MRYRVTASAADAGARLDRVLAAHLPELSRTRLKSLIEAGRVTANGAVIDEPARRVRPGQTFAIIVPETAPAIPQAQPIPLAVVYEDGDLIVVDKPAGLVVHPAPGNPDATLVNALLAHCGDSLSGIGGVRRPGIVHRLDKDTSGLMVVAKNDLAHLGLAAQFKARRIERAYKAVVWGAPRPRQDEIAGAIGRDPRNRRRMALVDRGGKPAVTRYRVLAGYGRSTETGVPLASLVECRLLTGRTHQIRVHLAAIGHPVVGDRTYGRPPGRRLGPLSPRARAAVAELDRQALHAVSLGFSHPRTGERLKFSSNLPSDIRNLISELERL
jgi:23S rRNA pseudouridine1911/1915/1917 synthase